MRRDGRVHGLRPELNQGCNQLARRAHPDDWHPAWRALLPAPLVPHQQPATVGSARCISQGQGPPTTRAEDVPNARYQHCEGRQSAHNQAEMKRDRVSD
eukprot:scaffold14938_cov130-Isochrysis_galbana.AAC.3